MKVGRAGAMFAGLLVAIRISTALGSVHFNAEQTPAGDSSSHDAAGHAFRDLGCTFPHAIHGYVTHGSMFVVTWGPMLCLGELFLLVKWR